MESDQIISEEKKVSEVGDNQSNDNSEDQEAFSKEDLQCRFYRNEWPEIDELVVVSTN